MLDFRKAIFFGAHTDDEMICAGTLHRLARQGCEVQVVTFAPAATVDDRIGGVKAANTVRHEWNTAMDVIGIREEHRYFVAMTPSVDLDPWAKIIRQFVFNVCEKESPNAVLYLSPEDENPAHAVVGIQCEAVLRGRVPWAIRCQFPWNYGIGRPNLYVTLSDKDIHAKQGVIEAYQSQHFRYKYGEMLMGYIRADGLSVKVEAAEKFEVIRGVI